jgi:hypothetical protein
MNLGIADVAAGSIEWTNDTFRVASAVTPNITIVGNLEASDGRPSRLVLHYNEFLHDVLYSYDAPIGDIALP